MRATRLLRLVIAAVLAAPAGAAVAHPAIPAPPPVDEKWLPAAALPAPPEPTVQREVCAVATTSESDEPSQLVNLDLPRIWQLTRGGGQRVAVIDTGVRRHPRLRDVVAGGDYVATGDGTQDCDAHGTMIAGIIAATANPDFSGIAPDATLISIRQSSSKFAPASRRSTTGVGDVATMAKAVRTAADLGASVIVISSIACVPAAQAFDDRALGAALAYAVDVKNSVVVAAAGGTAQCRTQPVVVSPAWYDDYVLTVGSVNSRGAPSSFTLAGPWVDVAAVGEGVTSLSPVTDGTVNRVDGQSLSGTSYAAPVVGAVAALIRARFPALTSRQVMQRIESTAHRPPAGWDPLVGNGTIDALAAVSTDTTPPTVVPGPRAVTLPVSVNPNPPDRHARDAAFGGTAACLAALLVAVGIRRRSGSRPHPVASD